MEHSLGLRRDKGGPALIQAQGSPYFLPWKFSVSTLLSILARHRMVAVEIAAETQTKVHFKMQQLASVLSTK